MTDGDDEIHIYQVIYTRKIKKSFEFPWPRSIECLPKENKKNHRKCLTASIDQFLDFFRMYVTLLNEKGFFFYKGYHFFS